MNKLLYRGKDIQVVLEAKDFNSFTDLKQLEEMFGDPRIFMTLEAWKKYDDMLLPPENVKHPIMEDK